MQRKNFCVRKFIKTESATAVQRAFRFRFNIQPPTRKSICLWNHQCEQIGCLCKGKSSGRPRVSEENVRRMEENFERSPRKSTRRASRELGIPQPSAMYSIESIFLHHPIFLVDFRYDGVTSIKSLSICMTTFSASLTNLTPLLPQSRD